MREGEQTRLTLMPIIFREIMLCMGRRNSYKGLPWTAEPADMEFKESIWQKEAKRNKRQSRMILFKK